VLDTGNLCRRVRVSTYSFLRSFLLYLVRCTNINEHMTFSCATKLGEEDLITL